MGRDPLPRAATGGEPSSGGLMQTVGRRQHQSPGRAYSGPTLGAYEPFPHRYDSGLPAGAELV